MRLRFFHAADGDCFLISSDATEPDGRDHHVLVDGGRKGAFQDNALDVVRTLPLSAVCVSHIDDDHISGILGLLEAEIDRRVEAFEDPDGDHGPPLQVDEIWYNGFPDLVGAEEAPAAADTLSATATLLAGSPDEALRDIAAAADNLAAGERSGEELTRRMRADQLDIGRRGVAGQPMTRDTDPSILVGDMTFLTLGPSQDDIDRLRQRWKKWRDAHTTLLEELHGDIATNETGLGAFHSITVAHPLLAAGLATDLGDGASSVTTPNLASLMFLVESGDRSALITGDGVSDEILAGLSHHGRIDLDDDDGALHVGLLKVQHHGAEANVTKEFVRRITADHYVFCGNGAHHNPELSVVEAFARARLEGLDGAVRGPADRPFTFHFTSRSTTPDLSNARVTHMKAVDKLVKKIRTDLDPDRERFSFEFLRTGDFEIDLDA